MAVLDPEGGTVTYRQLNELADRVRDRLVAMQVAPGNRIGLCMPKSIDVVAVIMGILKTGAAYVPVDAPAPASRNAYILSDCLTKVVFVDRTRETSLREEMKRIGHEPRLITIDVSAGGEGLSSELQRLDAESPATETATHLSSADDLAYILYTSGSTGKPKGVMISHRNSTSFVDWCVDEFQPKSDDRFSSHAPFHFDLSILDLYTPQAAGAALVLIPDELGKEPGRLAQLIEEMKLTVWYSAPSILSLLAMFGKLEQRDYSRLRLILFAGEVFPIVHLRALKKLVPHPEYYNLYGPTETNVCTFYKLPENIPDDRSDPYPIGVVCPHLKSRVVDLEGVDVPRGDEGELCIEGPSVLSGYWNLQEQTRNAFLTGEGPGLWYRTGDLVVEDASGDYQFVGRRDRMVKKRGYRVELGEIESCLYRHPEVAEAAVISLEDDEHGVRIKAHLVSRSGQRISIIALKSFCAKNIPMYMVPDLFAFHEALPKTSTDKIDYQRLKAMA